MYLFIGVEIGVAIAALVVFTVLYLFRSSWSGSPLGRVMAALVVVLLGGLVSLLLLWAGLSPPLWLFAAGFGLLDVVSVALLVQLVRAQRNGNTALLSGGTR